MRSFEKGIKNLDKKIIDKTESVLDKLDGLEARAFIVDEHFLANGVRCICQNAHKKQPF